MPEIITRHPEVLLRILKDGNIKCGVNEQQNILRACSQDKFCSSPSGELCVFGVEDASKLTQINVFDLFRTSKTLIPLSALLVMVFLLGLMAGMRITKKSKK